MLGPTSRERAIAFRGIRAPIWVSSGPGSVVAVVAELVAGEAARLGDDLLARLEGGGRLQVDLARRPGGRAEEGQVGHRDDRQNPSGGGDRPALRAALRVAVVEGQEQEQDHGQRRDADRRDRDRPRRLDHPQQLEQEEEVPLGPRRVGGGGRVDLRTLLGAEHDRQGHDHQSDDRASSSSPSSPRTGRTACPSSSGPRSRGGTPPSRPGSSHFLLAAATWAAQP